MATIIISQTISYQGNTELPGKITFYNELVNEAVQSTPAPLPSNFEIFSPTPTATPTATPAPCPAGTCSSSNQCATQTCGEPATTYYCTNAGGTYQWRTSTSCDDANACTAGDVCAGGVCAGTGSCTDEADCVSDTIPLSLITGETRTATMTLRNSGTSTWVQGGPNPYKLGSQNPADNIVWGLSRIDLPAATIGPDSDAAFSFSITAPPAAGT